MSYEKKKKALSKKVKDHYVEPPFRSRAKGALQQQWEERNGNHG